MEVNTMGKKSFTWWHMHTVHIACLVIFILLLAYAAR
jgi:hypothetical protein